MSRARVTVVSPASPMALHTLRERVRAFAASGHPAGRPRRRFLLQQAALLRERLQVILVVLTVAGASMVIAAALTSASAHDDKAGLAELAATIAFALGLAALPLVRTRTLARLQAIAVAETAIGCVALAGVARVSGGGLGPYALGAPVLVAGMNAHLPLSPRVSLLLAIGSYLVALSGLAGAPAAVHLLALATCGSGAWLAILRHRRALSSFLRIERLSARVVRLRALQDQLVVAEKLEGLRVLVCGMSHELNNALAVSVGSVQQARRALPDGALGAGATAALERASGGLARIRSTVDRLRRFASTPHDARGGPGQGGPVTGVLEAVDVGAMLDFALENAIGRARSGIAVDRDYEPEAGPLHVHVAALAEALFQVARNAVEAMPGGGTLRAAVRVVPGHVVISVADEGRGIPAEEAARVFDPYYSRGGANKAGMGLSAVYGLMRSLGGTIELQSAVGQGTRVLLFVPKEVSAIRAR